MGRACRVILTCVAHALRPLTRVGRAPRPRHVVFFEEKETADDASAGPELRSGVTGPRRDTEHGCYPRPAS